MSYSVKEIIKNRKSIRSFDGTPLRQEDQDSFAQYLRELDNPFGVPVEFRLLDASTAGLSSPVITGAGTYLAAKAERTGHYEFLTCV